MDMLDLVLAWHNSTELAPAADTVPFVRYIQRAQDSCGSIQRSGAAASRYIEQSREFVAER